MDNNFFIGNRQSLSNLIQGGVVVMTSYHAMQKSNDMAADFEQEANFKYLCGIGKPGWLMVHDGIRNHTWLVRPSIDINEMIFDGALSNDEALVISGANEIIDQVNFEALLQNIRRKHTTVYSITPKDFGNFVANPAQKLLCQQLDRIFEKTIDIRDDLTKLRAIKQPIEIKALEKAIKITSEGFDKFRNTIETLHYEYEAQAIFSYEIERRGAMHAYAPIIASGKNACTLHYVDNCSRLRARSLVLCDVGAKVDGYAADITRTLQFSKATNRQLSVHSEVVAAQRDIIDQIKPGLAVVDYLSYVDNRMHEAIKNLKLKASSQVDLVRRYMPHAISHGLGQDVHESLGKAEVFKPGMVLTVEPGIYIPEESIGVRIEDDILVTDKGHTNMSRMLSTEP